MEKLMSSSKICPNVYYKTKNPQDQFNKVVATTLNWSVQVK
jgi:hypothetical protein